MMNPYESPPTQPSLSPTSRYLDRGVLLIASIILFGCLISLAGFVSTSLRDFLMPRFGWIGLVIGMNSLIFIGFWIKEPSRRTLLSASFMTCMIGVINGVALFRSGTVDVVQNVFHDRVHSAWLWSVASFLCAGAYMGLTAIRNHDAPSNRDGE